MQTLGLLIVVSYYSFRALYWTVDLLMCAWLVIWILTFFVSLAFPVRYVYPPTSNIMLDCCCCYYCYYHYYYSYYHFYYVVVYFNSMFARVWLNDFHFYANFIFFLCLPFILFMLAAALLFWTIFSSSACTDYCFFWVLLSAATR